MVLYLQRRDRMSRVPLNVVQGLSLGVRDADGFGDPQVDDFLEGLPGVLEGYRCRFDGLVLCIRPPRLYVDRNFPQLLVPLYVTVVVCFLGTTSVNLLGTSTFQVQCT